jgi:hypothetical protein
MRTLAAGVVGGVVMFVWTSISHMALELGEAEIGEIPNEPAVLSAMQSNIGQQTGLYIFQASALARIQLGSKKTKP